MELVRRFLEGKLYWHGGAGLWAWDREALVYTK